ncbi:hypothetical protein LCGC14_0582210 [marine sediment metagenome]|uniref:Uncharacterized protein n=1 Tax=marine sediment metagenome TaxID=412755 RepID=A0A0F9U295_9ZZZZ
MVFSVKSTPAGFTPVRSQTGTERVNEYEIASAYGTSMFAGQPVRLSTGGQVNVLAAAADPIAGVFDGVFYVESDGNVVFRPYWPASTALQTGSVANAKLIDTRNQSFIALANADLTQAMMFEYSDLTPATATGGSTVTGRSTAQVDVSATDDVGGIDATNNVVQIIELSKKPGDLRSVIVQFIRPQYANWAAA